MVSKGFSERPNESSNLFPARLLSTSEEHAERPWRGRGFERPFIQVVDPRERRTLPDELQEFFNLRRLGGDADLDRPAPEVPDVSFHAAELPGSAVDGVPESDPLHPPLHHEPPGNLAVERHPAHST